MRSQMLLGIFVLFNAVTAMSEGLELGQPGYGGNGCPQGSLQATLSPDSTQLSILFDKFSAEAGREANKQIDRKSCNIAIPVKVPQGFSVSIFKVDYRGFVSVPSGGRAQFNVEYFFAGSQGPKFTKNFTQPQSDEFLITNEIQATALVWSECGIDVNLRTNANILAQTNSRKEQTIATVDSADVDNSIVYHVQWRRCGNSGGGSGSISNQFNQCLTSKLLAIDVDLPTDLIERETQLFLDRNRQSGMSVSVGCDYAVGHFTYLKQIVRDTLVQGCGNSFAQRLINQELIITQQRLASGMPTDQALRIVRDHFRANRHLCR